MKVQRVGNPIPLADTEERYLALVKRFSSNHEVAQSEKKGFGGAALTVNGKIFAMLDHKKRFVVKLPRPKVDQLVASGEGQRFDPRGGGRVMKEWFVIGSDSKLSWISLANEAKEYVSSR